MPRNIVKRLPGTLEGSMDIALGIDVGTSGVRVLAMDRGGAAVAVAETTMPPPSPVDGHLRQDPDVWWAAVTETLDELRIAVDFDHVAAIAVDGTSGTIVPVGAGGTPLGPASMYNDQAEESDVARVAAVAPRDTAASGATSPLARALAMQKTAGTERIVHQAD